MREPDRGSKYRVNADEAARYGPLIEGYLKQHIGQLQAVPAREIARAIGWHADTDGRKVRAIITERIGPGFLCASNGRGYFIAATEQEVRDHLADLKERELEIKVRYKRVSEAAAVVFKHATEQMALC